MTSSVISPSRALVEIVEPSGARLVVQRGWASTKDSSRRFDALADDVGTMVILHGDLPNLQPEDVTTLVGALPADGRPGVAIAPDRAGTGTRPPASGPHPFPVRGRGFAKHVAEVEAAGVPLVAVNRAGLAFDLDTPADLRPLARARGRCVTSRLELIALEGIGEIARVTTSWRTWRSPPPASSRDDDVLVVTQKIVSKAEGRLVGSRPSNRRHSLETGPSAGRRIRARSSSSSASRPRSSAWDPVA